MAGWVNRYGRMGGQVHCMAGWESRYMAGGEGRYGRSTERN